MSFWLRPQGGKRVCYQSDAKVTSECTQDILWHHKSGRGYGIERNAPFPPPNFVLDPVPFRNLWTLMLLGVALWPAGVAQWTIEVKMVDRAEQLRNFVPLLQNPRNTRLNQPVIRRRRKKKKPMTHHRIIFLLQRWRRNNSTDCR